MWIVIVIAVVAFLIWRMVNNYKKENAKYALMVSSCANCKLHMVDVQDIDGINQYMENYIDSYARGLISCVGLGSGNNAIWTADNLLKSSSTHPVTVGDLLHISSRAIFMASDESFQTPHNNFIALAVRCYNIISVIATINGCTDCASKFKEGAGKLSQKT
ncbi:MAG: hypothetical protein FWB96_05340 [Defluviitaleaceae bacterium]|nr:hypothetical protein [Defluviitaleaceae bacterium]MCL2263009.1 hypothetical protein [Defluviitaleaceae bacterium]